MLKLAYKAFHKSAIEKKQRPRAMELRRLCGLSLTAHADGSALQLPPDLPQLCAMSPSFVPQPGDLVSLATSSIRHMPCHPACYQPTVARDKQTTLVTSYSRKKETYLSRWLRGVVRPALWEGGSNDGKRHLSSLQNASALLARRRSEEAWQHLNDY